jgi:hypothetical protein
MTQKQHKSLVAELRAEIKEIKKALATAQQPAPYNPEPNTAPWPPCVWGGFPTSACNTATSTSDLRGVQVHL